MQKRFKQAYPLKDDPTLHNENYGADDPDEETLDGETTPKPSVEIKRLGTGDDDGRTTPVDAKTAEILQNTKSDFGGPINKIHVS